MVKVVCFANSNHVGLINLRRSIQPGWDPVVIGQGLPWKGWITRMTNYKDFCGSLLPEEVIVLSDAYDVLCLHGAERFEEEFKSFHCGIIVGAETGCAGNCHAPTVWWEKFEVPASEKRKYCNGGLIAGYAGELHKMWCWIIEQKFQDDQIGIGCFTDTFPAKIKLDIGSKLFFNDHLAQTSYVFIKDERKIVVDNAVIKPFFIHFQGLNIDSSVPFFKIFNTEDLFKVGKNYALIGQEINGKEHLTSFPADKRGSVLGICIERGVASGLIVALVIVIVVCVIIAHKKKAQTKKEL